MSDNSPPAGVSGTVSKSGLSRRVLFTGEGEDGESVTLRKRLSVYNVITTVLCTELAPEGSVGAVSVEDGAGVKFWTITQKDGRPSKTYSPTMSPWMVVHLPTLGTHVFVQREVTPAQ